MLRSAGRGASRLALEPARLLQPREIGAAYRHRVAIDETEREALPVALDSDKRAARHPTGAMYLQSRRAIELGDGIGQAQQGERAAALGATLRLGRYFRPLFPLRSRLTRDSRFL